MNMFSIFLTITLGSLMIMSLISFSIDIHKNEINKKDNTYYLNRIKKSKKELQDIKDENDRIEKKNKILLNEIKQLENELNLKRRWRYLNE